MRETERLLRSNRTSHNTAHSAPTTGLLAMWQSTAWLGAEAGAFRKRGIDLTLRWRWVDRRLQPGSFAVIGSSRRRGRVPVAEEVLKGHDVVILATPTSDFPKSCDIDQLYHPDLLAGPSCRTDTMARMEDGDQAARNRSED
jgi:hypothetical protein